MRLLALIVQVAFIAYGWFCSLSALLLEDWELARPWIAATAWCCCSLHLTIKK